MKCAIEVMDIYVNAKAEKERLAEIERQQKEEKRRQKELKRKAAVIEGTVKFCDTRLNDLLIKEANAANDEFKVTLPIRFNDSTHEEFCVLSEVKRPNSFDYWEQDSAWLDSKTFVDYLENNCFHLALKDNDYRLCNGKFFIHGATMTITFNIPDCL